MTALGPRLEEVGASAEQATGRDLHQLFATLTGGQ